MNGGNAITSPTGREARDSRYNLSVGLDRSDWKTKRRLLHRAIIDSVTEKDIVRIFEVLKNKALAGDYWCIREYLERTVGSVKQTVDVNERGTVAKFYVGFDPRTMDPGSQHALPPPPAEDKT